VHKALQVVLETRVQLGTVVSRVLPDLKVLSGLPDCRERLVRQVRVVPQDKLGRSAQQGLREIQEYRDQKACSEILAKLDHQVMLEIRDNKGLKVLKGNLVLLETEVQLVWQGLQDFKEVLAIQASPDK